MTRRVLEFAAGLLAIVGLWAVMLAWMVVLG